MPIDAVKNLFTGLLKEEESCLGSLFQRREHGPKAPPRASWLVALVLSALCLSSAAQTLTVTLVPSNYNGYNISCFGAADGAIDATVTGGTPPYSYSWSNAATTEDIAGLVIGYYELTVHDADSAKGSNHLTLTEPRALHIKVTTSEYPNGFNVSCWECYNGSIDIDVAGGVPPYTYSWSDGASTEDRSGLGVSDHRLDVLDDNGCPITSETVYLDQPEIFNYIWTTLGNEAIDPDTQFIGTRDTTDLVFKTNGEERLRIQGDGRIQMEPGPQGFLGRDEDGVIHVVPIETLATGMVQYFSEQMVDTFFTALSGLLSNLTLPLIGNEGTSPEQYFLGTTDTTDLVFKTNGEERLRIQADGQIKMAPGLPGFLTGNEDGLLEILPIETIETALADYSNANTFTLLGNEGTDPDIHFIGTRDSTDLVFKSNGEERLRLLASGSIRLADPTLEPGPLHLDADGVLRNGLLIQVPREPVTPCMDGLWPLDNWRSDGNHFGYPQCDPNDIPLLGTHTPHPISVITGGIERMHISTNGKVGIGTLPPGGALDGYRLFVEDGIATRDVMVKLGTWPDYVFADNYRLMPLNELRDFLKRNRHLPGIPSASVLEEQGGVAVGEMQRNLVRTVEE